MKTSRSAKLAAFLVPLVSLVLAGAPAGATTCQDSHGNCDVTVELSVFTGTPTVPCLIGHPVVRIVATVTCGGESSGPFDDLKCGIRSDDFVFSALGYTHTLSVADGFTWEGVLNGNCDAMEYRRQPN